MYMHMYQLEGALPIADQETAFIFRESKFSYCELLLLCV